VTTAFQHRRILLASQRLTIRLEPRLLIIISLIPRTVALGDCVEPDIQQWKFPSHPLRLSRRSRRTFVDQHYNFGTNMLDSTSYAFDANGRLYSGVNHARLAGADLSPFDSQDNPNLRRSQSPAGDHRRRRGTLTNTYSQNDVLVTIGPTTPKAANLNTMPSADSLPFAKMTPTTLAAVALRPARRAKWFS